MTSHFCPLTPIHKQTFLVWGWRRFSFFNLPHNPIPQGFPKGLSFWNKKQNGFQTVSLFSLATSVPQGNEAKACWDGKKRKGPYRGKKSNPHFQNVMWPYILFALLPLVYFKLLDSMFSCVLHNTCGVRRCVLWQSGCSSLSLGQFWGKLWSNPLGSWWSHPCC